MQPHSACDSAKNSSACCISALPSWLRHRARSSGVALAHGPESNARRAAEMAASTSARLASGASAIVASVAGEMSS